VKASIADTISHLNLAIKECETYLFITRDTSLQNDYRVKMKELQQQATELKAAAISQRNEDFANLFLGFECVAECLLAELSMWIDLKNGNPDRAWDNLVKAQSAGVASVRAHPGFSHNQEHVNRLEEIEKLVFPPQVFVSAGLIAKRQKCSICGAEYGECDHLAWRPYMGQFCFIVPKDITGDHVALVKDPADKRCRVTDFATEHGTRNRMTWKLDIHATSGNECGINPSGGNSSAMTCGAVILTTGN
jgi:hypothetical protein